MQEIKNLLNQVAIINKKNAEILDATGGRFNMFQICGVNHYENTHSAIIAEFLNPKGSHGLKSLLLKCFIETLGQDFTVKNFDCENADVKTEHSTNEGRIDIFIKDNQNHALIIENKIYAGDQQEQLQRYKKYAEQYGEKNYQIFYLTLFGDNASEQSAGSIEYLLISYKETIIEWLEKCISIAARFPMVRETIIQYINHLKQLTNQDMDTKNKEEIVELLIKNLDAAQAIYQNYDAIFETLAKKFFNPEMKKFAKQNDLEFQHLASKESRFQFKLTNLQWKNKCWIEFNNQYGIVHNPKNKISDNSYNELHIRLLDFKNDRDGWWPFYKPINVDVNTWKNDIIGSDKFFNDCKEKITELLKAMEGLEF
ncbi:hypothetical protein FACS1894182_10670 [Bacteroidia bacterium]|nr:hypothetical protein FACS1894182_10670 [Bacteroidia bacterium]